MKYAGRTLLELELRGKSEKCVIRYVPVQLLPHLHFAGCCFQRWLQESRSAPPWLLRPTGDLRDKINLIGAKTRHGKVSDYLSRVVQSCGAWWKPRGHRLLPAAGGFNIFRRGWDQGVKLSHQGGCESRKQGADRSFCSTIACSAFSAQISSQSWLLTSCWPATFPLIEMSCCYQSLLSKWIKKKKDIISTPQTLTWPIINRRKWRYGTAL